MNNVTETLPKGESIPRIPGNRFLQENWDPSSPIYGQSKSADIQKEMIIGWCPASKVFFEPKEDDRCLAVMLKSGRWCHMAYFVSLMALMIHQCMIILIISILKGWIERLLTIM